MKPYLKALCIGLLVTAAFTALASFMHMAIYTFAKEAFENFFGITVGKFNMWVAIIGWLIAANIMAIIIKSDFIEHKKN